MNALKRICITSSFFYILFLFLSRMVYVSHFHFQKPRCRKLCLRYQVLVVDMYRYASIVVFFFFLKSDANVIPIIVSGEITTKYPEISYKLINYAVMSLPASPVIVFFTLFSP